MNELTCSLTHEIHQNRLHVTGKINMHCNKLWVTCTISSLSNVSITKNSTNYN